MSADILQVLMHVRDQVKIYHWQTMSFARHTATDDLVSSLDESIDDFAETYMGKYGRPHFTAKNSSIQLYDVSDKKGHIVLEECISWLMNQLPKQLKKSDTDLLNIRDEIVGKINKTRYLFSLK
jgi:DNA-binding ferritin-like protein